MQDLSFATLWRGKQHGMEHISCFNYKVNIVIAHKAHSYYFYLGILYNISPWIKLLCRKSQGIHNYAEAFTRLVENQSASQEKQDKKK